MASKLIENRLHLSKVALSLTNLIIEIAIVLTTPARLCSVSDSWKLCEPRNLGSLAIAGLFIGSWAILSVTTLRRIAFLAILLGLCTEIHVHAQSANASLTGRITDYSKQSSRMPNYRHQYEHAHPL